MVAGFVGVFAAMAWTLHTLLPVNGLLWTCIFAPIIIEILENKIKAKFATLQLAETSTRG